MAISSSANTEGNRNKGIVFRCVQTKKISQNNKCMFLKIGVLTVHDAEITDTPELHTARWSEDMRVG